MLRFDVETIYKATEYDKLVETLKLRFDVETIYKATKTSCINNLNSCGLM